MNKYITTPIYYASGNPHLGHLYTTLVASCLKRHEQLSGHTALLASGTDEHGQKIERTATAANQTTHDFVDEKSRAFKQLWDDLKLPIDLFERTTEADHCDVARELWRRLQANGDIYKGQYEGLYCVECEQYFTSGDECPVHRKPLEQFSETSYFFRLSRYQQRLIDHIKSHPDFILPLSRRNEVLALLEQQELHDLSISRTSTAWGIPVPDDEEHVLYVWIDALATYLSALGPLDSDRLRDFWPQTVHCIGKDILVFHAVYWPALLWSAGLEPPKTLLVNGWLTVEGRKISKSDPDTIIDPTDLSSRVTCDGLQYYFLKTVSLGHDLDFRQDLLTQTVNNDLANTIGNLITRYIGIVQNFYPDGLVAEVDIQSELATLAQERTRAFISALDDFELTEAARSVLRLAADINRDIQNTKPWELSAGQPLATYLTSVYQAINDLTIIASVFIPDLAREARGRLGLAPPRYNDLATIPDEIKPVSKQQPLFARVN